jgi:hypothetical protein
MYRNLRSTLGVALVLLGLVSPVVFAADQPAKPLPAAQLIAVESGGHGKRPCAVDYRYPDE